MVMEKSALALKALIVIAILLVSVQTASSKESGGYHGGHHGYKCAVSYEYQTLNWNPPFAEARLKSTLEKLSEAGKAGFSIAESLPDGTGGQVLVLEKRIRKCDK